MEERNYIELVRKAQLGDRQSLNRLARLAREPLRVYVYRLTLQEDLTQEIVQETMLEMCRILTKLKRVDRFWSWLYGIATNKLHRHYRTERTRKKVTVSQMKGASATEARQEGLEKLVGQELKHIVSTAMQNLRTRHRAVLVMRCYDGMSYVEIADSVGCSEFGARMLFLRAKRALQKQLSRNGFGKGSLLAALVVFGKMTAPSEAAAAKISVTAATTKVGWLAGLVGTATTRTAVISLATAGVVTVGSVVVTTRPDNSIIKAGGPTAKVYVGGPLDQAAEAGGEYWYYFPQGPDNAVMVRVRPGSSDARPYNQLLQNELANYHFHNSTIHINNYRMYNPDLSVFRLPTDDPQLSEFISQVEGGETEMAYVPSRDRGLLVIAARGDDIDNNHSWVIRHYNVLDEDYFQSDWPIGAGTIDNRDAMHERGWTYFRINGQIDGKKITGNGRIAFVYAASRLYRPWLRLEVEQGPRIIDDSRAACICDAAGRVVSTYRQGSFFKGLARPWMGLHTIDTVRRDAAEQRIGFETRYVRRDKKVQVELTCEQHTLLYVIDLERDLVESIAFSTDGNNRGCLEFSYLDDVDEADDTFAEPRVKSDAAPQQADIGLLWLVGLLGDSMN